jgi:hypothetical protein
LNIRAHYSEKISVETLASASGMSRRFLSASSTNHPSVPE